MSRHYPVEISEWRTIPAMEEGYMEPSEVYIPLSPQHSLRPASEQLHRASRDHRVHRVLALSAFW